MKYLILIMALIGSTSLSAQSIERQVIGSTGGYSGSGNLVVSSTAGEAVVASSSSTNMMLSAGFQQANENSTSIESPSFEASINLYPNPTSAVSKLEITTQSLNPEVHIQVYSATGVLISSSKLSLVSGIKSTASIDLKSQAVGIYFVKIANANNVVLQTVSLVKV